MTDTSSVKVAVRIRPLVPSEVAEGCKNILDVVKENDKIIVRTKDKVEQFSFNYVLSSSTPQEELYTRCVQPLIGNLFMGYNVTVLAYGQTGSGKTHSMGTDYKGEENKGCIPRAITDIFGYVKDHSSLDFTITVSFLELYQDVFYDLLSDKPRNQCILKLREDPAEGVYIPGLTELPVTSEADVLNALTKGSKGRVTRSTAMNSQSSRSHAILTVKIGINNKENCRENKQAKLHLVDLAGSERIKKTGAVGNTVKEVFSINKGLFVLGNVIRCLGDGQNRFIPYRDSNLTRLLKDSLGGHSITLMIACICPSNVSATLSTLRYAMVVGKIKNKPMINQQWRIQTVGEGGPVICPEEIKKLKKENADLKIKLDTALLDKTSLQRANEALNKKFNSLKEQYDLSVGIENQDTDIIKNKFLEINSEQRKTEAEIRDHEESVNKNLMNVPMKNTVPSGEIQEKEEYHNTRQMALNSELLEVQKQLVLKESLAPQLASNNQYLVDYKVVSEIESKITVLQKEKEELLQHLKNVQTSSPSNKLAEQRRKRVQEIEAQLHDLNKKVREQSCLIKLKENEVHGEIVRLSSSLLHDRATLQQHVLAKINKKTWHEFGGTNKRLCQCMTDCAKSSLCGCRRLQRKCQSSCYCIRRICKNRDIESCASEEVPLPPKRRSPYRT